MSNRLTFSLASLIVLLAFGLVFAPMSVLAHDDTGSAGGLPGHIHPMITISSAGADDADGTITLTFADADTTDAAAFPTEAEFEIQVDFDVRVTPGTGGALTPAFIFYDANRNVLAQDGTTLGSSLAAVAPRTSIDLDDDDDTTNTAAAGTTYTSKVTVTDARDPAADDFAAVAYVLVTIPAAAGTGLDRFDSNLNLLATNGVASEEATRVLTVTATPSGKPLPQPSNVMVTDLGARYRVSWDAPSDTTDVEGYYVQYNGMTMYVSGAATTTTTIGAMPTSLMVWSTDDTEDMTPTGPPAHVMPAEADLSQGIPTPKAPEIVIPTATSSSDPINLGAQFDDTMLPGYGFAVLVRDYDGSGLWPPTTWLLSNNASLPDLAWFFGGDGGPNTGTIALRGSGVSAKDLIISEIMWGRDSSLAMEACSQWIEFYNATPNPIDLSNFTITFHRSLAFPDLTGAIDTVSNVGHVYFGNSTFPGSSGRSNAVDTSGRFAQPVDLVSMHRVLNHVRIRQQNIANRGERNKGIGGWAASSYESANIGSYHVATPGAEQLVRTRLGNSSPRQHVIINEIGNSSNNAHDWIELYNTGAAISIENWELMRVTARSGGGGTESFIARFPKVTIPANSYVVITKTHPRTQGNDLAAGIDLAKGDADQLNRGLGSKPDSTTAYYLVDGELTLPNDDNRCLYILRHAHDREGQPTHIEDVVGTLGLTLRGPSTASWTWYSANDRRVWDTAMWPLQGRGGPHGDVVHDAGPEHFGAGRVYQRSGKNSGTGEHHLSVRGYTGIGYDRIAPNNAENGGTPGYSNGSLVGDKSAWAGQVSFSEIMLVTHTDAADGRVPRATRLPQWLEIYNSSMTQGVSINNWYLEIQNADTEDLDTRDLHGTLRLPNMTIPPNQTILITTSAGLNSGHFPEHRLINLFLNGTYRNILTIQARGDSVLSQVGFYVELRDHKGNHVDEIGNLAVRHNDPRLGVEVRDRGNFSTTWDIPDMITPDGHRTSLIRIYDNSAPRDGLMGVGGPKNTETSWILASNTNFRRVPNLTYYGNHQDYGTPGYRGGGPLPVGLSMFRPQRLDDGSVLIRWVTDSETNNAGFNILRSDKRDGEFTKLNTQLIAGQGTTSERTTYEFTDKSAKPNVVHYYQIQDVSIDGDVQILRTTHLRGHVSATGKATTTWGRLKALQ